ncbi:hypothetical protein [Streptomyces sp. NPDC059957]
MATYAQLTEWAGLEHVTRARQDVVAGWRIPGPTTEMICMWGL